MIDEIYSTRLYNYDRSLLYRYDIHMYTYQEVCISMIDVCRDSRRSRIETRTSMIDVCIEIIYSYTSMIEACIGTAALEEHSLDDLKTQRRDISFSPETKLSTFFFLSFSSSLFLLTRRIVNSRQRNPLVSSLS